MTDPVREDKTPHKWIWTIVLILLAIVATFWFARPLGEPEQVETVEPVAQSTEWVPVPEGSAVPVTLPETPLRNVPAEPREAEKK
jgi:hypothetical protein